MEKENILMSHKKSSGWDGAKRTEKGVLPYKPFPELPFADTVSSLICKVGEQTVESGADEEEHAGAPMRSEGYFDPTKSRAELE